LATDRLRLCKQRHEDGGHKAMISQSIWSTLQQAPREWLPVSIISSRCM